MLKRSGTNSGSNAGAQGNSSEALRAVDALYRLEMKTNLAALRARRRRTRLQKSIAQWKEYWPVAAGGAISLFAPLLRDILSLVPPWGMWLVFPLAVLAERPEVYMGHEMAVLLPSIMLYAQFPLEGLLAKFALKGNVTVKDVTSQVLLFHILCIVELWLVNGAVWRVLPH